MNIANRPAERSQKEMYYELKRLDNDVLRLKEQKEENEKKRREGEREKTNTVKTKSLKHSVRPVLSHHRNGASFRRETKRASYWWKDSDATA